MTEAILAYLRKQTEILRHRKSEKLAGDFRFMDRLMMTKKIVNFELR